MVRCDLAVKISVLIVVVLIIGFGASTILTIQRESELLVEQSKMAARRLTATLVASIEGAMLQERPDVTRTVHPGAEDAPRRCEGLDRLPAQRRGGVHRPRHRDGGRQERGPAPRTSSTNIKKMARPPGADGDRAACSRGRCESLQTQESLEMRDGATLLHAAPSDR